MIQLLLDRGVDVHAEDGDGLTPLQQMAELFLEPERRDRALSYQRSIGPMMMFGDTSGLVLGIIQGPEFAAFV